MQPVAPIGWPSAYCSAVRVYLRRVETEVLGHRHGLHGERFVRLDHVHVGRLEAGFLEHALHRRDRAEAHDLGLDARVGIGHQARHRLQVVLLCMRRRSHDDRRARIVDPRRIARGHRAVLLEHGLQPAEVGHVRVLAHVLVGRELLDAFSCS
jgi:hypothetical protein